MKKLLVGGVVMSLAAVVGVSVGATGKVAIVGDDSHVALVAEDLPYQGSNGFAGLYTLGKDVPENLREQVLAEDARRHTQVLANVSNAPEYTWNSKLDDYASLPAKGRDGWCDRGVSCLDLVRGDVPRTVDLVKKSAKSLAQVEALAKYDHFRSPFKAHPSFPVPNYTVLFGSLTHNALRFVQGDTEQALTGVCSSVLTGKRLLSGGDILVGSVVGASLVEQNATLLTQMMAELPATHPIPATCKRAFAGEMDTQAHVCRGMLSEGKMAVGGVGREYVERSFDAKRTAALMAPDYTWYCSSEVAKRITQDLPVDKGRSASPAKGAACLGNEVGCVMASMAVPHYYNYAMRMQDAAAVFGVASELVEFQARGQTGKDLIAPQLNSPQRGFELAGNAATINLFKGAHGKLEWSAPLPGSQVLAAK